MAKAKAFDAAILNTVEACNRPVEIEIKHPTTGDPTGLFISVVGKDGDIYRGRLRAVSEEMLRKQAAGKAASNTRLSELERKHIDALAAATVSWRSEGDDSHIMLNGEPLECTPANARRLYSEILPIQEQVAEAIADLGNFMTA